MSRFILVFILMFCAGSASAEAISVSAAISLKASLLEISKEYEALSGDKIEFNFGASGQLAAQIEQGAPADLFISSGQAQVQMLQKQGRLADSGPRIVAGNRLVLITPAGATRINSFQALASAEVRRVALGQPKTVPAGEYAMKALQTLRLAERLQDRLVYGANVRQVLDYVMRGEVEAGLVYASDARDAGDKVRVAAFAPEQWHGPILYPAAVIRSSPRPAAAARFLQYLTQARAQEILTQHGFLRPPPTEPR